MANRYPLILDSSNNKIKELPSGDNLDLTGAGISSVSSVSVGTAVTIGTYGIHATGVVTATSFIGDGSGLTGVANTEFIVGTAATFSSEISVAGITTADATGVNVTGVVTATTFVGALTGNVTGELVGSAVTTFTHGLHVTGVTSMSSDVIVGGGLTVSGISTFASTVHIGGSGSGAGAGTTDYSEVTLSGLSPSSFNETYSRQTTGFVLDTGTVASGNALFHADSSYYYYVATTGSDPEDRMLIWSVEDNSWMAVFDFGDPDYSEGNVSNNQAVGSVFTASVTANTITADGREVPEASSDIVYATSSVSSGIGVTITADGDAKFVGVVTAAAFHGDVTGELVGSAVTTFTHGLHVTGVTTSSGGFVGNVTGTATGLSGTPDIAIGDLTASGNVSIAGTLTYQDVTNMDVLGIGTFQQGIQILANGVDVTGFSTFKTGVSITGVCTATDFNSTSDTSVKENIQVIEDPLASIVRIDGVTFTWKDSGKKGAGVTAQNLEKVLPNLVSNGDLKSVNYNGLIGYLVEAIKSQQVQIDELKSRLDSL